MTDFAIYVAFSPERTLFMFAPHLALHFFLSTWLILFSCTNSVLAADSAASSGEDLPLMVVKSRLEDMSQGGSAEKLLRRAAKKGTIHIIVGLRFNQRRDSTVTAAQEEEDVRAIRKLQADVVGLDLGGGGAHVQYKYSFIPFMSVYANEQQLRNLLADSNVISLQEVIPHVITIEKPIKPGLPEGRLSTSGASDVNWYDSVDFIHASDVWNLGAKGAGQVVAIFDTGVDKKHPTLKDKVISEACYSTTNAAEKLISFCTSGSTSPGSGANVSCKDKNISDPTLCDHGTHVAAITAGRKFGVFKGGVAPDAELISIVMFSAQNSGTAKLPKWVLTWTDSDLIASFDRVFKLNEILKQQRKNISAINLSISDGSISSVPCDSVNSNTFATWAAVERLRKVGIPTIAASGNLSENNEQKTRFPACLSNIIAVGATTKTDFLAKWSDYSSKVFVVAPGAEIYSAAPGNTFKPSSGTSQATPQVSGAFALLRGANRSRNFQDIDWALRTNGRPVYKRAANPDVDLPHRNEYDHPYRLDILSDYSCFVKLPARGWQFSSEMEGRDWDTGGWGVQKKKWTIVGGRLNPPETEVPPIPTKAYFNGCLDQNNRVTVGFFAGNKLAVGNQPGVGHSVSMYVNGVQLRLRNNLASMSGPKEEACNSNVRVVDNSLNAISVESSGIERKFFVNNKLACTLRLKQPSNYPQGVILYGNDVPGFWVSYDSVSIKPLP